MNSQKIRRGCFIALTICIVVYTAWYVYGTTSAGAVNECEGIIRFHVVANSDSAEDQQLKLKVRDALLKQINTGLVRETMIRDDVTASGIRDSQTSGIATLSIEESRRYLQDNIKVIETLAEEIVAKAGYEYPVTANLGVCWIPEKTYGDITFPAGNYEALNINIGEAKGQNWWCVLYPPLCLIDPGNEAASSETSDVIYSATTTEQAITLKFKTLEILQKESGDVSRDSFLSRHRAVHGPADTAVSTVTVRLPATW